jgi:hypothetical protein
MLHLTANARDILRKVPHQPSLGPGAGLRISRSRAEDRSREDVFVTTLATRPRRGDEVVDCEGARVFLGPLAARRFEGARLDARTDDLGRIEFVVRPA